MSSSFVTDKDFSPEIGNYYEISFGEIDYQGSVELVSARIKVIGGGKHNWVDLKTGDQIDEALFKFKVKAYKEMSYLDATTTPLTNI
ncbi:MAG: hypothetical protein ACI8YC_000758 [Salibacteraceae bacterium]|jgi:hypothetical protein